MCEIVFTKGVNICIFNKEKYSHDKKKFVLFVLGTGNILIKQFRLTFHKNKLNLDTVQTI